MSSHSEIGRSCMMKNLISKLKYSAFLNSCPPEPWRRRTHSAIGRRGFTLIEIIILIVLAGILIPVIIIPFATGVRGSGKPEKVTTAMYFAQQKMEEFMKYHYFRSALNPTALTAYADIDAVNFPGYQWRWSISQVVPNATNGFTSSTLEGYKQIMVRVRDPDLTEYEVYAVATFFPRGD